MEFNLAKKSEIDQIMYIINIAQEHFKGEGIDQWQNNYPNSDVIERDIENNSSYVLKDGQEVLGTVMISFDGESTYNKIYEGQWLSQGDYAVIHRMAVDFNHRGTGLASRFLDKIEKMCIERNTPSIKVDTHRENLPMQKLLLKNGYKECGIIYLNDGNERLAYEKLLK